MNQKLTAWNFPTVYKPYIDFIELMLTPARFQHCLGAAQCMAKAYHVYPQSHTAVQDWILAGLLHDVLKEASLSTMLWWINRHKVRLLDDIPAHLHGCPTYLHGPAGSVYVRHALGLADRDRDFYAAIAEHAGEYPNMCLMARCLHIADMCCPTTEYRGYAKLARIFFQGRLDEAEMLLDTWIIESVVDFGVPVHPRYPERVAELKRKIKPAPGFFSRTDP